MEINTAGVVLTLLLCPYLLVLFTLVFFGRNVKLLKKTNRGSLNFNPPVTVLLPTFNEEDYIARKLSNLLQQDYSTLEILVADCSTDNSRRILAEFQGQHPNINVIYQPSRVGNARTMNAAVLEAQGEIIIKTDCDSVCISNDCLKKLVSNFEDPKLGAATGICKGSDNSDKFYRNFLTKLQIAESNIDSTVIGHSTSLLAFRKSFFEPVSEKSMAEDTEEMLLIRKKGAKVIVDPSVVSKEVIPKGFGSRNRQKSRRAEGILDAILGSEAAFRSKYGKYGLYVLPIELFLLAVSPVLIFAVVATTLYFLYSLSPLVFFGGLVLGASLAVIFRNQTRAIAETQIESLQAAFRILLKRPQNPLWEKVR
jgi:poly-beta-1,6-N-acetyl-D-glucosamine synthase